MDEIQKSFYAVADKQPLATLLKESLVWYVLRNITKFEGEGYYKNGHEVESHWESDPDHFRTLAFKYNGYWHVVFSNHPKLHERIVLIACKSLPDLISFFHNSELCGETEVISWLKSQYAKHCRKN
jgi:hypothetical protein